MVVALRPEADNHHVSYVLGENAMAGTTWVWEPPAGADVLFAPGAPFEIATEPVLGVDCKVFKNRLGNIREVLTAFTARHGDLPNLVFPEITLTFNDVQASTARVAAWFAERGVVKGDRVAFASANVASYVIGWWATLASGAIVSSLNGWWTPGELLHGIELSKPRLVFADGPRMKRLLEAGLPEDVAVHDLSELDHLLGPARADDPSLPSVAINEDDPAGLLFTSGTTGRPKAACLSHRNFVHFPSAATLAGAVGAVLAPQPAPAAAAPAGLT